MTSVLLADDQTPFGDFFKRQFGDDLTWIQSAGEAARQVSTPAPSGEGAPWCAKIRAGCGWVVVWSGALGRVRMSCSSR